MNCGYVHWEMLILKMVIVYVYTVPFRILISVNVSKQSLQIQKNYLQKCWMQLLLSVLLRPTTQV
ncbi:hypothetical protein D3C81_948390 [compost metagenome]